MPLNQQDDANLNLLLIYDNDIHVCVYVRMYMLFLKFRPMECHDQLNYSQHNLTDDIPSKRELF